MTNDKKEEKTKNTKRRLLLLVLLLACTLVFITTASYAWFTSNKRVAIDELQVNVSAVNGLEISADAIEWSTRINKDKLIDSIHNTSNQLPNILTNVSSAGIVNDGDMEVFFGDVLESEGACSDVFGCYTISAYSTPTTKSCYDKRADGTVHDPGCPKDARLMAFDIYLKLDGSNYPEEGVQLYLTSNAGVTGIGSRNTGIQNTARVAFVQQGYISKDEYLDGKDGVDGDVLIANKKEGNSAIVWEPNADGHTDGGIVNASRYGIDPDASGIYYYSGIKKAFADEKLSLFEATDANYPDYFERPSSLFKTNETNEIDTQIPGLKIKVGVTKLRVYFWVEGQDVDTENNASGSDMALNIQFAIQ